MAPVSDKQPISAGEELKSVRQIENRSSKELDEQVREDCQALLYVGPCSHDEVHLAAELPLEGRLDLDP
jgi:hypothetical protein